MTAAVEQYGDLLRAKRLAELQLLTAEVALEKFMREYRASIPIRPPIILGGEPVQTNYDLVVAIARDFAGPFTVADLQREAEARLQGRELKRFNYGHRFALARLVTECRLERTPDEYQFIR